MYGGQYLNKGKVGRWKEQFNEELIQKFERFEKEGLKGNGSKIRLCTLMISDKIYNKNLSEKQCLIAIYRM